MKQLLYLVCFSLLITAFSCKGKKEEDKSYNNDYHIVDTITENKYNKLSEDKIKEFSGKENEVISADNFKNIISEIAYVNDSNVKHKLDLIYPTGKSEKYNVILLIHGGGWATGDKRSENLSAILKSNKNGYVIASINYRLSDEVMWPKPLHDAKAAIRYLRANKEKYNLETTNIIAWGYSTGGHIAQMLAATNGNKEFEDLTMGNSNHSSDIQGVVSWSGISNISELPEDFTTAANAIMGFNVRLRRNLTSYANPQELVTAKYPPILLVHGTEDRTVPFEQSVQMQTIVNESAGRQIAELFPIEGAGHEYNKKQAKESFEAGINFINRLSGFTH